MLSVSKEHIEITPGTCGGRPRIAGTRITVADIFIWHEQMGMSPHEIVATYTHLTLAGVHAALAYFFDNEEEIRARIAADEAFAEEMRQGQPSILETARSRHAKDTPVPSR